MQPEDAASGIVGKLRHVCFILVEMIVNPPTDNVIPMRAGFRAVEAERPLRAGVQDMKLQPEERVPPAAAPEAAM